ncbi:CGNR zinc finger domain-containing protein [Agreia sp.]|uniref:CGNR zinc finger domain-containing protein n=1 Tax=Agreia sp. TaxID=1872416 RepID=UPI0035BC53DE
MKDEELLLRVLNSAPVTGGVVVDELDDARGVELVRRLGGSGSTREMEQLRRVRAALHAVVRGSTADGRHELAAILGSAVRIPRITPLGVQWELQAPTDDQLGVRTVLAWSAVIEQFPGRLRACANEACNLFLIDHSRPGMAKWCSMASCGNRMKARAHADRARLS